MTVFDWGLTERRLADASDGVCFCWVGVTPRDHILEWQRWQASAVALQLDLGLLRPAICIRNNLGMKPTHIQFGGNGLLLYKLTISMVATLF